MKIPLKNFGIEPDTKDYDLDELKKAVLILVFYALYWVILEISPKKLKKVISPKRGDSLKRLKNLKVLKKALADW